jgi:hypothetical protein
MFAGTFTYKMETHLSNVTFSGAGTATVKIALDPDTGKWVSEAGKLSDPSITLQ